MRDFPQELIDQVIFSLKGDARSLRNSRLVCQSWNASASPHAWRTLDLTVSASPSEAAAHASAASQEDRGLEKLRGLLHLLETSTDLQRCVREVTLGRTALLSSTKEVTEMSYPLVLSKIFGHLNRIISLSMREVDWSNLSAMFQSTLVESCKLPSLQSIDVWNCQYPSVATFLHFLSSLEGIQELRLTHIRILNLSLNDDEELAVAKDVYQQHQNSLRSLTIDSMPIPLGLYTLLGVRGTIDFTKLRRLCLNNIMDIATVRECLERSGSSLEHLELKASPFYRRNSDSDSTTLNLAQCPNLRHARISGLQWTASLCAAQGLAATFSTVDNPCSSLESLHLFVMAVMPKHSQSHIAMSPMSLLPSSQTTDPLMTAPVPKELDYRAWSVLDDTLSRPQFGSFKHFHLHVTTLRGGDIDSSRLLEVFKGLKSTCVEVHCSVNA